MARSCGARYGVPALAAAKRFSSMSGFAPLAIALRHLRADVVGRLGAHHRPQRGRLVGRRAEVVAVDHRHRRLDEAVINRLVHVDALHGTARLPGVEVAGIDDVLRREGEVGVGAHVGRVLAAELEAGRRKIRRRRDRGHHGAPAGGRAGEADLVDEAGGDRPMRRLVRHVEHLKHIRRQVRLAEAVGEVLGDERGLAGVLHDHGVAGDDRGQHGVQRRHVGEVPRRQVEHHAQRLAADEAGEAFLGADVDISERLRRDGGHIAGALLEAAHLPRPIADRPPHLPGEQLGHPRLVGDHGVGEGGGDPRPLGDRHLAPLQLRGAGAG